ncbi:RNA polymerase sigma-70 factor [Algoriphagus sp. NG3]|uniref:RNA polymerase sigma-70 factor n=1 Tax=Algoriphagus sp. NG3 TaxID=3097546 RepID=UPI002A831AEF|nr:RNA polymerase sigma-70 factor [Algoriphagus sp. NG3]WPR77029.1 RNA polymerase sigma-70 factor [Algoriphagus sp. NG3]
MSNLKLTDDQGLLLLIRQNNYGAFDELYRRYWKSLYLTASKKIGCKDDAMDLVQDLFVELWNTRTTIEIHSSLSSYLYSSLYYKTFRYFRIKGLKDKHIQNFMEFLKGELTYEHKLGDSSPIEKEQEYRLLQEIINQAIEDMPCKMREIFIMAKKENHSVNEVAEAFNLSPQTVKNQVGNAMKRLKKVAHSLPVEFPTGHLLILAFLN